MQRTVSGRTPLKGGGKKRHFQSEEVWRMNLIVLCCFVLLMLVTAVYSLELLDLWPEYKLKWCLVRKATSKMSSLSRVRGTAGIHSATPDKNLSTPSINLYENQHQKREKRGRWDETGGWHGLQKDKPHTHWTWSLGGNIIKKANRQSQTAPRTIWATQCDTVEVQEKGQEEQGRQIKHQGWERICAADVNISPSSYWCKMDSTFPLLIITLACSPLGMYSFESAGQSSCVSSSSKFILWAESIDFITLPFPRLSLMKRGSE